MAMVWARSAASATKDSSSGYATTGGLDSESLTTIRRDTALNAQPDIITKYRKYLLEAMEIGIDKGLRVGLATGGIWAVVLCTYAITLWYGSQQIADTLQNGYPQKQTGGTVYASFFACLIGAYGLCQLVPSLAAFNTARVAAKAFLSVIERKPLVDGLSEEGAKPESRPAGRVILNNIAFSYPSRPETMVCNGLNLVVEPGQSCALVGMSSSDKVR